MKFTRSKKLLFCNNKGGVGKTLLAFNTAVYFAQKGYKTALIDLDPQCNLSRLCIGESFEEENLLPKNRKNIYDVIKGIVEGGSDIDISVKLENTKYTNLFILPGSPELSYFESILSNAYNFAASGNRIGYFQTSSIDRFLMQKEIDDGFDIKTIVKMGRNNMVGIQSVVNF
jgi:cellulose biosynthesis protein BcsQ